MIARFAVLLIALCALPVFAAERAAVSEDGVKNLSGSELFSVSAAFVAGVDDYQKGWPDLPGVRRDLDSVTDVLSAAGFQVERAENLTKSEFLTSFNKFISKYSDNEKARLLVYFAGHGYTLNGAGYIVFADAAAPKTDMKGFKNGAVPMSFFAEISKEMNAPHALFVFDSCFAGTVFSAVRSIPELVIDLLNLPVRQFISSGTEKQMVPDDSVFRRRFADGISGRGDVNGDGVITGSELGEYLRESVSAYTAGTQTPVHGKMVGYDGEFMFFYRDFAVRQPERQTTTPEVYYTEKEELIAKIKENPYSPEAEKAMARLREIDETLDNMPPVEAPERKDFVMTAKSAKYTPIKDAAYPYVIIAPLRVPTMAGDFVTALRIKAKCGSAYKKLMEREKMLLSVMSRRMKESNLQLVSDISEIRERIRESAMDAAEWVCPGCTVEQPVIAGLKGL